MPLPQNFFTPNEPMLPVVDQMPIVEAILNLPSANPPGIGTPDRMTADTPQLPTIAPFPPIAPLPMPGINPFQSRAEFGTPTAAPAPRGFPADDFIRLLLQAAPALALGVAGRRSGIAGAGSVAAGISQALQQRQENLQRERVLGLDERRIAAEEKRHIEAEKQRITAAVTGILDRARDDIRAYSFNPKDFIRFKSQLRQDLDQYAAGHLADTVHFPDRQYLDAVNKEAKTRFDDFVKIHFDNDYITALDALSDPIESKYYHQMSAYSPVQGVTTTLHDVIDTLGLHDEEHRVLPPKRKKGALREVPTGQRGESTFLREEDIEGKVFTKANEPERARAGPSVITYNEAGDTEIVMTDEFGKTRRVRIPASAGFKPRGVGDGELEQELLKFLREQDQESPGGPAGGVPDKTKTPKQRLQEYRKR